MREKIVKKNKRIMKVMRSFSHLMTKVERDTDWCEMTGGGRLDDDKVTAGCNYSCLSAVSVAYTKSWRRFVAVRATRIVCATAAKVRLLESSVSLQYFFTGQGEVVKWMTNPKARFEIFWNFQWASSFSSSLKRTHRPYRGKSILSLFVECLKVS